MSRARDSHPTPPPCPVCGAPRQRGLISPYPRPCAHKRLTLSPALDLLEIHPAALDLLEIHRSQL